MIISDKFDNQGNITSNGSSGGGATSYGGNGAGSGAGSINIFCNELITRGTINATGGSGNTYNAHDCGYGGNGRKWLCLCW